MIQLLTEVPVSIEDAIYQRFPSVYANPKAHIAPATAVLVSLIGLAQILVLYQWITGRYERVLTNLAGIVSSLVILSSALFTLGYIYQAPLQYGSIYIPISLPAAVASLLSGIGIVLTIGEAAVPFSWFAGASTRARLLRAFLPLTALLLLLLSLAQYLLIRLTTVNPAIAAAVLIILFEIIISVAILQVARVMGNLIDRAEQERRQAATALSQLNETLEERVRERTIQLTQALEREQTARAEAESARAHTQSLLEAAPDAIVIVDAQGRIVLINNQTEVLSGYSREELIGHAVEMLIPERYEEAHEKHRADFMAAPRTRPMGVGLDLDLRRKDSSEVPVEISLSPVQAAAGMLVTAAIRDITDRKRAEAEIKRLNDELQHHVEQLVATNKELEAFSYSVSHDLRAPLRSIDGFSNILMENYPDRLDERGKDYLTRVRTAAQRMARLIDDMLNLSRIGRAEMHWESVDLSEITALVVEDLRQRDPERQVDVEITPGVQVNGDPALLHIVLDNLLGNAWKFTSHRQQARIEFGMTTQDDELVYFVRDNGAGFDMSYADKLFTPFQRLHTEEEFPGTGIGLAIVQRIIARHGGRIWAEGTEGQGATFYFTLEASNHE
ncbi:MAG: PAS domain S-box protein [Armatimonadota bacterium]